MEAWIYTDADTETASTEELSEMLAELGFAPRRVVAGSGSLRPNGDGVEVDRPPELALVVGDLGLCGALQRDEDLGDVPILLAVPGEQLGVSAGINEGHELVVLPVAAAELTARIQRARGRVKGIDADETVRIGSLTINLATYQVTVAGRPIDFTYMEYELLKFMVTHPDRAFSREALLSRVWGFDYYGGARTVDVHVRRLRSKLGTEHAARIRTVRSVGYLFAREVR
jgi:DNA-binding response OmpR family regulator